MGWAMSARVSYLFREEVTIELPFDTQIHGGGSRGTETLATMTLSDAVSLYYALKDLPEVAARIAAAEGASA